ncbi:MAG: porin [Roseobacter sp.]
MKKLLIATTALVGTASVAAADITMSGYGRFGLLFEEDRSNATGDLEETRLEQRYRLNIDSSTETDGGVRFAARIRIEANEGNDGQSGQGLINSARFQVSAGGLRVRVGNISGVHDAAEVINFFGFEPGLVGQVGYYNTFAGGSAPVDAYSGSGQGVTGINVKYEAGDFAVMASYSEDYDDKDQTTSADDFEAFEIGASYAVAGWTFGVAYASADFGTGNATGALDGVEADAWTATATGSLGVADVAFFLGDTDVTGDDIAYGVSGSIPVGAATDIVASYAGGGADALDDSYGIGFAHSLGGGVTLKGMVGRNTSENTVADLGVIFNF